ncbi:conserved membrane hypothetical protein [Gammaproteobacteria bacterium]
MSYLFKIFVDILLLQAGPQNLPASRFLLNAATLLYFFSGILVSLLNFSFLSAIGISIMDTALLALMAWLPLRMRNFANRTPQTLTAIFGALGLFSIISLPMDIWFTTLSNTEQNFNQIPSLIMIFLSVWSLAALGHILRHALEITSIVAAGLSLLYMILSLFITTLLFIPTVGNGGAS